MPNIGFSDRIERITEHLRMLIEVTKRHEHDMARAGEFGEKILQPVYDDLQAALLDEPTRWDMRWPSLVDPEIKQFDGTAQG